VIAARRQVHARSVADAQPRVTGDGARSRDAFAGSAGHASTRFAARAAIVVVAVEPPAGVAARAEAGVANYSAIAARAGGLTVRGAGTHLVARAAVGRIALRVDARATAILLAVLTIEPAFTVTAHFAARTGVTAGSAVVRIGGGLDACAVARREAVVAQDLAGAGHAAGIAVRGSIAAVIAAAAMPRIPAEVCAKAVALVPPRVATETAGAAVAACDRAGRDDAPSVTAAAVLGRALDVNASAAAVLFAGLAAVGASALRADLPLRARLAALPAVRGVARNVHATAVAGAKWCVASDRARAGDARGIAAGSRRASMPARSAVTHVAGEVLATQATR